MYEDLRRLYVTRQYLENFVHEASIAVLKIHGLNKMLTAKRPDGKDPSKAVAEAVQNLRRQATNFHWLAIDAEDEYSIQGKTTGGLESVEGSFVDAVVMADDIPRSILLGETPGGLNSGENAGEIRSYYDWISVMQDQQLSPIVTRVAEIWFATEFNRSSIAAATDDTIIPYPVPEKFTVSWESLWQTTELDEIAQAKTEAEVDKAYVDMGVITVEEVRQQRIIEGNRGPLQIPEEPATGKGQGAPIAIVQMIADIVEKVTTGLVPGESAIQMLMLAQPSTTEEKANAIIDPAASIVCVVPEAASGW